MKTAPIISLIFVVSFCLTAVGGASEKYPQLTHLLEEADSNNPSLLAAFEQIAVARSIKDQVASLADPVLSLSLSNYPIDELQPDISPMTGNEVRLAQQFPFPGKLDSKGKIAAQKSRWFTSAYQDARLQIRQKVKDAWYRLIFQKQAIGLTSRNLELLEDFIRLTETRYEVGKGLQQNVLKAHLQRSKQLDKLLMLQQQQEATLAELNSLIGRQTDQTLLIPEPLDPPSINYSLSDLKMQAEQNRPMYAAFDALIDQYKEQRTLAELDYRPDFTLWAGYRFRDNGLADGGTDFVSAGLSFNLPVRRAKRAAAVAETDSSLRMAYQKRSDFNNKVQLAIHRSLSKLEQSTQLVDLYRNGIIPQATQTFQATLSAYQVDKVDFLTLLDSVMSLYQYEIDHARTLSEQQRSLAELEAAAGLEINQLKKTATPAEG
ncbi:MAG TPA: TolC family protein [Geopsychrobacteraceae bacterium]|nr:TolC family protein [Geopsychrobacteraceae bacterium]